MKHLTTTNLAGAPKRALALLLGICSAGHVSAEGTLAGTDISNTADVSYEIGGTAVNQSSNTVTITVAEVIDVAVVLQSPQVAVSAGDTNEALIFTLTNTGNAEEAFSLLVDNADTGDDFDPVAAIPNLFFDTDASGDLSVGDEAYVPGSNDPLLAADASVVVIVVNDIPVGLSNGDVGRSALIATALTGAGAPGTIFAGQGTGGVDAVVGSSGGSASAIGEYIVSDVAIAIDKSAVVVDLLGGDQPVPGATINYTITFEVSGTGTATALVFRDPIPANTTYIPGSLTFNGQPLTDQQDADAGEFEAGVIPPAVTVQVGDLDAAAGLQTVRFSVLID
ncbi:MAG: DUF11 domain-containing protein [Pseudomonadota bacterium]